MIRLLRLPAAADNAAMQTEPFTADLAPAISVVRYDGQAANVLDKSGLRGPMALPVTQLGEPAGM